MLGNSGGDAPDGLWDRIADQLEDDAAADAARCSGAGPGTVVPLAPRARADARTNRFVAAALGAAAALVDRGAGRPGGAASRTGSTTMESALEETTLEAAANQAFDDPDAVKVQLQSSDGAVAGAGRGAPRRHRVPDGPRAARPRRRPHLPALGRHRGRQPRVARAARRRPRHHRRSRPAPTCRPWRSPPRTPAACRSRRTRRSSPAPSTDRPSPTRSRPGAGGFLQRPGLGFRTPPGTRTQNLRIKSPTL